MRRALPLFSIVVLVVVAAWLWALRAGPGRLELPPLDPWPMALAARMPMSEPDVMSREMMVLCILRIPPMFW